MKISRNSERLRIIVAMTVIFWAGSAMAQEQLCNTLGSVCICSEQLNTLSFSWDGVDSISETVNPTDVNSKQCKASAGGNAFQVGASVGSEPAIPGLVPIAETGMPTNNTVDYVWRWNRGHGLIIAVGNATLQPTTKRVCYRQYFRLSPNYDGGNIATDPTSPNCNAGKFSQTDWGSHAYSLQLSAGGCYGRNCDFEWGRQVWPGSPAVLFPSDADLNYSDCYGQWCRAETCVSGNFAAGGGNYYAEGYVKVITGPQAGKTKNWPRYNLGTGSPGLNMSIAWLVNGYAGDAQERLACTNGVPQDRTNRGAWREYSHLMQAEWPVDVAGTFIGPAVEIEGGGSASPPPPSVPSAELGKPGTPTYQAQ